MGFNLVDAPWIPVRYRDETSCRLIGLRQAFQDQRSIAMVTGASPLSSFTLYRLLLAIAHRALQGPRNTESWAELLEHGEVDAGRVCAYLDTWRQRFDLFDSQHPFYQDATAVGKEIGPVSKLFQERAGGNNATLFDHAWDDNGATLTPAQAAVQLLVVQAYSLGGLVSVPEGADAAHKSAKAGPLVKTVGVLVGGPDLGTILVRNMVPYVAGKKPFETQKEDDLPAWEREEPVGIEPRWPRGYLDLLTWQSRRIRLVEEEGLVTGVYLFKGQPLPDGYELHGRDPALAFRKNRDPKAQQAWLTLSFDESRALWRDAEVFARATKTEADGAPLVLKELADAAELVSNFPRNWPLEAYGLASDQAKALLWRSERLEWPAAYLTGRAIDLAKGLERAIGHADGVARTLGGNLVRLPSKEPDGKPLEVSAPLRLLFAELGSGKETRGRAEGLGAAARYWSALGPAFQRLVLTLPSDVPGGLAASPEALRAWDQAVCRAAKSAYEAATTAFERGARQMRARAKADQAFYGQLATLSKAYLKNERVPERAAEEAIV